MLKKSLGVSEVVASVLMLIITIVVSLVIYLWYTGYLSTVESSVNKFLFEEELSLREKFEIVHVSVVKDSSSSSLNITVYVFNYGDIMVAIDDVAYVDDGMVTLSREYTVLPGQCVKIEFPPLPYNNLPSLVKIKIVSKRGNYAEYCVKKP